MDLLQTLQTRGVCVRIDGHRLLVSPPDLLTDDLREAIRADKPELLRLPEALMGAITRCCAARGDDDANRAALILECLALPAWEQRELLQHFTEQAEMFEAAVRGIAS